MEFAEIKTSEFDIKKAPNPYPTSKPDRDGDYDNADKDYSKASSYSSEDSDDIHSRSDLDSSKKSQHHTIGSGPFNAAAGNHIHDGVTSKKLGANLGIVITGSRGGNAAVASILAALKLVMEFTDTTTP